MTTFTASEVRESAIVVVSRDMEYEAEMLRAYADRLEADEKAAPAAWLASCPGPTCVSAPFLTREEAQECGNAWDHCYVTPLYTHPSPADAEGLAEALERTARHRAAADRIDPDQWRSVLYSWEDRALAAHSTQAQPPANTERLVELLRGLEIGPMAAMLSPKELFAIGAAIAAQAKEAQPPAASVTDIDTMVNRFLSWRLPQDFAPDAGISFKPMPDEYMPHCWPTGTNLFHAGQVKEMILHMLAAQENPNG